MFREIKKTKLTYKATAELAIMREKCEMTMRDVAAKLGFTPGYYSRIENGQIEINEDTCRRINVLLHRKKKQ